MKYAQIVIGPAGTGKSTYCHILQEHCLNVGRTVHVANMDPAAEAFKYTPAFGEGCCVHDCGGALNHHGVFWDVPACRPPRPHFS